ncbi:Uncharacterised protein [Candidatus Tiddalikarchaeum anstoanum]|nr:Uncharacterised protein [Candidatus Tiddalikarchaeum anstoanum]
MNKKSQFFLISTVALAISLTTIVLLYTIPYQLSINNLLSQNSGVSELSTLIKSLNSLTNTLYNSWPSMQSYRTNFEILNVNAEKVGDEPFIITLPINDYARVTSMELRDEDGRLLDASYSSPDNGTLTISFKDTLEGGISKTYNVYYDIISDEKSVLKEAVVNSRVIETLSSLNYKSPYYNIVFNKNNGVVTELEVEGDNNNLATNYYARTRIGGTDYDETGMTANFSYDYHNNVASILIEGDIVSGVRLTQHYFLHPEGIILYQDYTITSSGTYNLSYVLDTTESLDSLAYDNTVNIGLVEPAETIFNSENYHTLFKDNTGLSIINLDNSITTISTGGGMHSRIQLASNSYNSGTYTQRIIIVPYFNNYTTSKMISMASLNNPAKITTLSKSQYLAYQFEPLLYLSKGYSDILTFSEQNSAESTRTVYTSNYYTNIPTGNSFRTSNNIDYDTLNVTRLGENVPHGITTKNHNYNSQLGFFITNNAGLNVDGTIINLLNIDGKNFTLSINMNSLQVSDTLTLNVFSPNNILVKSEVLVPSIPGSFEEKTITINGLNESGTYKVNLSGDNVVFTLHSTTPLLNVQLPFIINSTLNDSLYFETDNDFYLNITSLDGDKIIILNNSANTFINEVTPVNEIITHHYYGFTPYYLTLEGGTILLDGNVNLGKEEYYLNNENAVEVVLYDSFIGKQEYDLAYDESNTGYYRQETNISFIESANTLENKDYSWDLDNEVFIYKNSNNWFYNGDFYACMGVYGACSTETTNFTYDALLDDNELFKTASFNSDSIKPVITVYNDSSLFKIVISNPIGLNYYFGLNIRINGDADTYYKTSFTQEQPLSVTEFINSTIIDETGWSYIGKRDSTSAAALFAKTSDLEQGSVTGIISNDYLRMGLNGFGTKTLYFYIGDDWNSVEKVESYLNSMPESRNEPINYFYTYTSGNVKSIGTLIG